MLYQEVGAAGEKDMFAEADKSMSEEQATGAAGGSPPPPLDMENK
jgi:hypothetical protein